MSTVRLTAKLIQIGHTEDELADLERADLQTLYAKAILSGSDKPQAKADPAPSGVAESQLDRDRLTFEINKFQQQQALERDKLTQQQAIRERELAQQQAERERELALERDKLAQQQAIREQELAQQMKIEREKNETERKRLDVERDKIQLERLNAERLATHNDEILRLQRDQQSLDEQRNTSLAARTKLFAQSISHALPRMGEDPIDAPLFFDNVSKLFERYKVPADIQTVLLHPHLSNKAKNLLARMDQSAVNNFVDVRDFLLNQFRLTPADYRKRFNEITRKSDESNVLFSSRLYTLLQFYVNSRKANSLDKLMSCLVSDRIRSSITDYNCSRHIASLESTADEGWLDHIEISRAIDAYYANLPSSNKYNMTSGSAQNRNAAQPAASVNSTQVTDNDRRESSQSNQSSGSRDKQRQAKNNSAPQQTSAASNVTRTQSTFCFVCGLDDHVAFACPQRYDRVHGTRNATPNQKERNPQNNQRKSARVFTCKGNNSSQPGSLHSTEPIAVTSDSMPHSVTYTAQSVSQSVSHAPPQQQQQYRNTRNSNFENDTIVKEPFTLNRVATRTVDSPKQTIENDSIDLFVNFSPNKAQANPDYCPLQYVSVAIENVPYCVNGMIDSGAETAVAHTSLFPETLPSSVGKITLRGIYGKPIVADLVLLNIRLANNASSPYMPIYCALSPDVNETLILTLDIVRRLSDYQFTANNSQSVLCDSDDTVDDDDLTDEHASSDDAYVFSNLQASPNPVNTSTSSCTTSSNDSSSLSVDTQNIPLFDKSDSEKFKSEQKADESLVHCWRLARNNKGGFFVKDDLLYHQDNIAGQIVHQLVVPKPRIANLLDLSHRYTHSSGRRLLQRLRYSFHFPRMKQLTHAFVQSCHTCQLKAKITYRDRVKITAIPRSTLPYESIFADVLGPINATNPLTYNYVLITVDSHSRDTWAKPLRQVTAKSICDALIELWSCTSMPLTISSDNHSVFSSKLNHEFLKRLNVSPLFISPLHSNAVGLVEKHLGVVKSMINRAALENPNDYTKILPLILWFLRETPVATTNTAPWTLCHGFPPRGIVELVKRNWSGEIALPPDLQKTQAQYMTDLQHNLTVARKYANDVATKMQASYVHQYNLRAKNKSFQIGDKVIILLPNSTTKAFARWQGPAEIVAKKSANSYLVEFQGARRHLHANFLRPYHTRIEELKCSANSMFEADNIVYTHDTISFQTYRCSIITDTADESGLHYNSPIAHFYTEKLFRTYPLTACREYASETTRKKRNSNGISQF